MGSGRPDPDAKERTGPAFVRVSIIVPALDEARAYRRHARRAAAMAGRRPRGHRGGRRKPRRDRRACNAAGGPRLRCAKGPRAADERRRGHGRRRHPALPACRFAPARRRRGDAVARAGQIGPSLGALRRGNRRTRPRAALRRGTHEPALARHGHRDRRPGDLRRARAVPGGRRISRPAADGGHRDVAAPEARRRLAALPAAAGRHVGAPLGAARALADRDRDVAVALRVLARRATGRPRGRVRCGCARRRG